MIAPSNKIEPSKIKSFQYLINQIQQKDSELHIPMYSLLIGAGCSYKCGIPLGGQLIEICKIYSYIKNECSGIETYLKECEQKHDMDSLNTLIKNKGEEAKFKKYVADREEILKSKISQPLHLDRIKALFGDITKGKEDDVWKNFEEKIIEDSKYGFWMDEFSEDPMERQKFIEKIIDDKQPNGAYILLAYLVEQGVFSNLLTTNFDDLINEALIYYTDQRCRFYADDEISQYISVHSKKPNIIKVHGDYRFANMKNTEVETEKLSSNISIKLRELLSQIGIIVVDYNGADHSIMNALYEIKKDRKYSLIWCGRNPDDVHWRVAQLINETQNSFFVQIDGFDEMMGKLAPKLFKKPPEQGLLIEKAKNRVSEINNYFKKFRIEFSNSDVSKQEVKELEETLDKWELFNKGYSAEDPYEQIEHYSKAIAMDNKFILAYNNRGVAYMKLRKDDDAMLDFDTILNIQPQYSLALGNRAKVYYNKREYDKAIEDCKNVLIYDGADKDMYIIMAEAYKEIKKDKEAIEVVMMYKVLQGEDPFFFNFFADMHRKNKNASEASLWVEKGLAIYPQYPILLATKAEIYALQKDDENFYLMLEKATMLGLKPDDIDIQEDDYKQYIGRDRFNAILEQMKKNDN